MTDQSSRHQSLSNRSKQIPAEHPARSLPLSTTAPLFSVQPIGSHVHALCTALFTPCRLPPTEGVDLMERELLVHGRTRRHSANQPPPSLVVLDRHTGPTPSASPSYGGIRQHARATSPAIHYSY